MVLQVCNSGWGGVRCRRMSEGPVSLLGKWPLVIGCLTFISFAPLLYPSRSPTGAAPSGTASFIAVRSRGGREGGGGVAEGAECCREKAVEGMGSGRHGRLSNLNR